VESSLVRVSWCQGAKWVFVRFHGFRRAGSRVEKVVVSLRIAIRRHDFNHDSSSVAPGKSRSFAKDAEPMIDAIALTHTGHIGHGRTSVSDRDS
jgi:hypothetical protein